MEDHDPPLRNNFSNRTHDVLAVGTMDRLIEKLFELCIKFHELGLHRHGNTVQRKCISALAKGLATPWKYSFDHETLSVQPNVPRKIRFRVRLNFQSQFTFRITYLLFASQD